MSPYEIVRQVARATGESVSEIRSRGFSLHCPHSVTDDAAPRRPRRRRRGRRSRSKNGTPI